MTVSSQIIEVLNDLCMKFGIAIDWSAKNVVPYAQELAAKFISWEIATSWMWIVVGVVITIVGFILVLADYKTQFMDGFAIFLGVVIIALAMTLIVIQAYDIITCTHFPELKFYDFLKVKLSS